MMDEVTNMTQAIMAQQDTIKELQAVNAELLAALEAVEFVEGKDLIRCPWCEGRWLWGHAPDCQRQAAIARAKEAAND